MILHNLIISKISKGFISAENERYVQHVNTQRSLVENLIECNNISTLEQLEKTSCAGKRTCLSYTFTLCLECLLLTKLYNVLKITQFLCVFFLLSMLPTGLHPKTCFFLWQAWGVLTGLTITFLPLNDHHPRW